MGTGGEGRLDNGAKVQRAHHMDSVSEIMLAIRAGRALLGLSQAEVAQLSGVSRQIVVRIENGENNVLVDAIEKVRVALERQGVVFFSSTDAHGPGVALARRSV